jgi:hypothetical protein
VAWAPGSRTPHPGFAGPQALAYAEAEAKPSKVDYIKDTIEDMADKVRAARGPSDPPAPPRRRH